MAVFGCVNANKKNILLQAIKNHVVDHAALFVEQQVVLRLEQLGTRQVVGGHALAKIQSPFAAHFDLTHVTHVKEPGVTAHG